MSWLFVSDTRAIMAQRAVPSAATRPRRPPLRRPGVPPVADDGARDERPVVCDGLQTAPTVGDPLTGEATITATSG
ncbi:hypothetical protein XF36_08935 [Pseudonocardia sp. HH130629-09]|nr:hypothetical protein XF36_08935 [Pseudonocardia sp. HH130629-09]